MAILLQVYKMSSKYRGRALVINNTHFTAPGIEQRVGSEVDVNNLSGLLTSLKFELTVADDFTAEVNMKCV